MTSDPGFKGMPLFSVDYLRNGTELQWNSNWNLHMPMMPY